MAPEVLSPVKRLFPRWSSCSEILIALQKWPGFHGLLRENNQLKYQFRTLAMCPKVHNANLNEPVRVLQL